MVVAEWTGIIACLPHVTTASAAEIEVLSIFRMRAAEGASEGVGSFGNGYKVDVVAHQAEGPYRELEMIGVAA
jgi:hypothetical protein